MYRLIYLGVACVVAALLTGSPQAAFADDHSALVATAGGAANAAAPGSGRISLANSKNPFEMLSPDSPEISALSLLAQDGFITENLSALADKKPMTRYKAAIIAAEAITNAETMIHNGKLAAISSQDQAALQQTFESFKSDLATLKGRVDTLDTRVSTLEQSQTSMHNEMTQLNETVAGVIPKITKPGFELHGEFRVRPVNGFSQTASGVNPVGAPLPAGSTFTRTGAVGDLGAMIPIGDNGFGQMEARLRLVGTGHIGDNATYIIRLSTEENGGANNGLGSWVHNDFDFFDYNVPKTSWEFYGGKLLYCCNTPWLPNGSGLVADAVPIGMAVKWTSPNRHISAWGSAGSVKNAQTSPTFISKPPNNIGFTQNVSAFHVEGNLGTILVAYNYMALNSQPMTNFVGGVPVLGLGPVSVGSFYATGHISPMLSAQAEYLSRYGNDSSTKKTWTDSGAFLFDLNLGGTGQYQSSGRFRYVTTGQNSVISGYSIINSVDSMWNGQFLPTATNVRLYELGYSYRFDKNGHLDLDYGNSSLGTNLTGIDGSTLRKDDRHLFVVTSGFNF